MNRWTMLLVALIGAALGALGMWTVAGRQADEATIRRTLVAHPDIITEAMQALQDRETGKLVAQADATLTQPIGNALSGNPKGDVSVVEFFDYNCGYCRASLPVIAALVKADPNVRVVYRELPILAQSSHAAARASLTAARQGRWPAFHDALYTGGPVSDASIASAAAKAGVDLSKAGSAKNEAEIAANLKAAAQLGINGTPSWIIGNRVLSGALPLEELQRAVAAARGR
ncbi:Protein-disulfide isomerase [Sphingomonas gellani]|uniref:Protein-disulfide isomerase n=1 Tax=Sphingomonas gellani TaxID=1166340 RepID=A0A1H8JHA8_9SPHN|nr:DsbA family protein [Sphingomonas gellani]SEN79835.1 Protein-disulfide isomerase [Sphingomonas gellani]